MAVLQFTQYPANWSVVEILVASLAIAVCAVPDGVDGIDHQLNRTVGPWIYRLEDDI